jgi:hypothetical protein
VSTGNEYCDTVAAYKKPSLSPPPILREERKGMVANRRVYIWNFFIETLRRVETLRARQRVNESFSERPKSCVVVG